MQYLLKTHEMYHIKGPALLADKPTGSWHEWSTVAANSGTACWGRNVHKPREEV